MNSRHHWNGCLVLLLLLLGVAISCNRPGPPSASESPKSSARINEENYNKIVLNLDETDVMDILGYRNYEGVQIPGCQRTLGEIPGFEAGFRIEVKLPGLQDTYHVKPSEPVWWKKWTDPDVEGCWIAVCFFSEGEGGAFSEPWVVAKRKGGF